MGEKSGKKPFLAVFGPIEIWRSGFSPHSNPVAKKEDFFATRLLWGENSTHPEIQTQITQALKIRQNGVLSQRFFFVFVSGHFFFCNVFLKKVELFEFPRIRDPWND